MPLWDKLFWKIHCFKVRRISNSTNGSSLKQCILKKESCTRNGVGVGHFLANLQIPTHEISLFPSLNTLNAFFLYKTQKQPIMSLSGQFQLFSTFQSD